ncbi:MULTISPECIES: DUF6569 family protein [unclassified Moorena]|uniref:ARPP-1 family domain-containing protein n=1 Tax=unclassified Moorena TaxID=2683338 RepID=UPI0013B626B0|nr:MULTISPECIES: DUF6569 family protein [unclassified Moorena]NEP36497.1 hypothetical protein [Moorena sp. SIO3B2]NEQ05405.1 hypothetical protein [Moorena sp. SIO4E2]
MDCHQLVQNVFDLSPYRFGIPQKSGVLTVVPIFGGENRVQFVGPLSGLKLLRVDGYGNIEVANPSEAGIAIVPLHMGYIQDGAQNHALCRSAFIAAGQKLMFRDACCVQESQGGYLESRQQWFFILPLHLRNEALGQRGIESYSKLWHGISRLNQQLGLPNRGHLEQILSRKRAFLTQYQSRLELLSGQTGALFFLRDKLAGIEIAPNAAYFQEMWMPLVCFCYGVGAMVEEHHTKEESQPTLALCASNLRELRDQLLASRVKWQQQVSNWLAQTPPEKFTTKEEERFLNLRLETVIGKNFAGQFVEEEGRLVYGSVFGKPEYLSGKSVSASVPEP